MLINDLDTSFGVLVPHDSTRVQSPRRTAALTTRAKRHKARAARKVEALEAMIGNLNPGNAWHIITTGGEDDPQ